MNWYWPNCESKLKRTHKNVMYVIQLIFFFFFFSKQRNENKREKKSTTIWCERGREDDRFDSIYTKFTYIENLWWMFQNENWCFTCSVSSVVCGFLFPKRKNVIFLFRFAHSALSPRSTLFLFAKRKEFSLSFVVLDFSIQFLVLVAYHKIYGW